jgi:hypothetical protein
MSVQPQLIAIDDGGVQLVVVYDGPRGAPGTPGAPGAAGDDGTSIQVLGEWNDATTYVHGNAVTSRGAAAPGIDSLWFVRLGYAPTVGVPPHLEPAKWSEVGTGADALGPVWHVAQINHGFTMVGQPAYFSPVSSRYELADTRYAERLAIAAVREITDTNNLVLQVGGVLPGLDPGVIYGDPPWQPGRIYYLSTVPGRLQLEDPGLAGRISQPFLVPTDADGDLGILLDWGPEMRLPAVFVNSEPPSSPEQGMLWYRTDAWPGLYIYLLDASGVTGMWVQTNG